MMIDWQTIQCIEAKDYAALNAWIKQNSQKAKFVFELMQSQYILKQLHHALNPEKTCISIKVKPLKKALTVLEGQSFLVPLFTTANLVTRGNDTDPHLASKWASHVHTPSKAYIFIWGEIHFHQEDMVTLFIKHPFREFRIKRDARHYGRYRYQKNLMISLKKGNYLLEMDTKALQIQLAIT